MKKRVLIISQAITQDYCNILVNSIRDNVDVDIITGSDINGKNVIHSPAHVSTSLRGRLVCWIKHYRFIMSWARREKKNALVEAVNPDWKELET